MSNLQLVHTPPPMRGIKAAITEIKASDPCTALTERGLRRLVLNGSIPYVKVGRKYLINMNTLYDYLENSVTETGNKATYGNIRPIKE